MNPKPCLKPIRTFDAAALQAPRGSQLFRLPAGFAEGTPIDLEIGCGVGWHPIRYARANPDRILIAIEHTREKFSRFQSRLERHEPIANLIAIHADAVAWVTHCLGSQRLSRCFFLYPNPNPKAASKRWIRMPFLRRLLTHLSDDGELIFATNELFYRDEILAYGPGAWDMGVSRHLEFNQATKPPELPRTHFEKKYLARGETCFEVRLHKIHWHPQPTFDTGGAP